MADKSLLYSVAINKLPKADKGLREKYVHYAREHMGGAENTAFIAEDVSECVALHSLGKLDVLIRSLVEYPIGSFLCVGSPSHPL